jgi:protein-tyrosine phosphatase
VKILFVCLGNICRSPVLEAVARETFGAAGLATEAFEFDSAGTGDWHVGHPPDPRSRATAVRFGIDLDHLRARQLHLDDYRRFDLILCADRDNLRIVRERAPADASARLALVLEYAGLGDLEVPDPYLGGAADFEQVHRLAEQVARALLERWGPAS